MIKILVTEPEFFPYECLSKLQRVGEVIKKRLSHEELVKAVEDTDVLLVRVETKVDREVIDNAKNLKIIASATTGLNHIDVKYAEEKKILVINPATYATESTAEYTFALILSLARRIPWAFESVKNGDWERFNFIGNQLSGKTLGIIGLGKIGKNVAKYGLSFGMRVQAYDPYVSEENVNKLGIEKVSLEDLLKQSDVITLNLALTPETENMINKNTLTLMKHTAILVNASRGKIINELELLEALNNQKLTAAALDVFVDEPLTEDNQLMKYANNHNNLLLTPHLGGSTKESINSACNYLVERILEYLQKSGS